MVNHKINGFYAYFILSIKELMNENVKKIRTQLFEKSLGTLGVTYTQNFRQKSVRQRL